MLCCAVACLRCPGAPACKKINDYSQCGGEGNTCPTELGGKCIDGPWKGERAKHMLLVAVSSPWGIAWSIADFAPLVLW